MSKIKHIVQLKLKTKEQLNLQQDGEGNYFITASSREKDLLFPWEIDLLGKWVEAKRLREEGIFAYELVGPYPQDSLWREEYIEEVVDAN